MLKIHTPAPRWGFDYLASLDPLFDLRLWGNGHLAMELGNTDCEGSAVTLAHEVLRELGEPEYMTGISGDCRVSLLAPFRSGESREAAAVRIAGDLAGLLSERIQLTA